jgi:hypothetical protein
MPSCPSSSFLFGSFLLRSFSLSRRSCSCARRRYLLGALTPGICRSCFGCFLDTPGHRCFCFTDSGLYGCLRQSPRGFSREIGDLIDYRFSVLLCLIGPLTFVHFTLLLLGTLHLPSCASPKSSTLLRASESLARWRASRAGGSGNSSAGGAGAARTTRYPNSGDGLQLPQAK